MINLVLSCFFFFEDLCVYLYLLIIKCRLENSISVLVKLFFIFKLYIMYMFKFKILKKVKLRYLMLNKLYGVILLFLILFCNVFVLLCKVFNWVKINKV